MFHKILVATDFSDHANAALAQAVWVASRSGGEITLAYVVTDLATAAAEVSFDIRHEIMAGHIDKVREELRHLCRERLEEQLAPFRSAGVTLRHETMLGTPFVEIIRTVQSEGHDLVLPGTRGLRGVKRFFLGSTAKRLIRKCPSSVWVVHASHSWPPKKIVAATDFSDVSWKARRQAAWLAHHAGAELHLLHVLEPAVNEMTPREAKRVARQQLDESLKTEGPEAISVSMHLNRSPEPWRSITALAGRIDADLVAMGTVGRSGVAGVMLGNTAEKVLLSCKCDILTVKPDGFVSPIRLGYVPHRAEK